MPTHTYKGLASRRAAPGCPQHMAVRHEMGVSQTLGRLGVIPNGSRIVADFGLREYSADVHLPSFSLTNRSISPCSACRPVARFE